ncbi:MAG: hypothetical protein LBE65_03280 [Synergistaceae bacterium]|nr:hypothetical protein [Synergistaceae bacterium]
MKVSESDFESIEISADKFHPDWNYIICKKMS